MHFSRVKDCVLVAVQRRNAGRASHGILQNKKMREAKTALKSGSSPLALSSFPKLPVAFAVSPQRLDGLSEGGRLQRSFFSEAHFPEPCAR